MNYDQQRTITKRLRMSMKTLRETMEEIQDSVGQYNALGSQSFTDYGAHPTWPTDQGDLTAAEFATAVATLNTFMNTYAAGHNTNINKAQTPV